jgi:hypothetical protein
MKFCIDCVHLNPDNGNCHHTARLDPVYGKTIFTLASIERAYNTKTSCGEEARNFKERESEDLDDLSKIPFGR